MSSETVPCSPTPACDANYTTTTTYDALDRPWTKLPAARDLSAADRGLSNQTNFTFGYYAPFGEVIESTDAGGATAGVAT